MKNGHRKTSAPPKFVARQICPEFNLSPHEAEVVGAELIRLGAKLDADGNPVGLAARKIVEAAEKKASPLHRYIFGRSDEVIVRTAREALARKLVNSVRIEIVLISGEREVQPVMVNLKPAPSMKRGYVSTVTAQASQYMTDQKFTDAVHRLNGWLDEFRAFRHGVKLGPIWESVRALLKEHGAIDDAEQKTQALVASRMNKTNGKRSNRADQARAA